MSQIIKPLSSSGPIPPNIPTSFQAQNDGVNDGSATPAVNIINFNVTDTTADNANGFVVAASGNTVTHTLTNRYRQEGTTSGGATSTVTILSALAAGTYTLDMSVAGYSTAGTPAGNGYTIVGSVKSVAGVASLVGGAGAQQKDSFEDTVGANAVMGVSGNDITVTFTGVAGNDFNWLVTGTYIYRS